ncbi:MAG: restriction endonuclease subunit S, partial [Candidatus Humimicrobiaceae bacterium]
EIIGREAPLRARRQIRYNDVIMSTVRPYLKAFAIIPKLYDGQICSTGFAVLSCKEKVLPKFLLYILFSKSLVSQFNREMVGAQYPALNSSQVKKLKIPLPSISEQEKIAEILSAVDERIQLLKEKKNKLERVKKGLMNELLTGRIRVKVEA